MTLARVACSFLSVAALVAAAGCAPAVEAPDNRAQDAQAIQDADNAASSAALAKDVEKLVTYYTADAVILPPNAPMSTGHDGIRKEFQTMTSIPGASISWRPTKAEAARSGDIGYSYGTYDFSMTGPDGKPFAERGKYMTVWKKQSDGSWKIALDQFNSDTPPPPPPPAPPIKK